MLEEYNDNNKYTLISELHSWYNYMHLTYVGFHDYE